MTALVQNGRHAIIWTNDALCYSCIYKSLGIHGLNKYTFFNERSWLSKFNGTSAQKLQIRLLFRLGAISADG